MAHHTLGHKLNNYRQQNLVFLKSGINHLFDLGPTLEALGAGIVHTPADQSHSQPQKNQKYPVFSHLGHYVTPHTSQAIWSREIKLMISLIHLSLHFFYHIHRSVLTRGQ